MNKVYFLSSLETKICFITQPTATAFELPTQMFPLHLKLFASEIKSTGKNNRGSDEQSNNCFFFLKPIYTAFSQKLSPNADSSRSISGI